MTPEQVLQDFAYLEKADIDACFEHAARHANRQLYFFEAAGPISAIEVSAVQYDHAELRPYAKRHTNTPLRQRLLF